VAKFSEQFIQQVAQATDIVDLIGQFVALKKRGKEYVGLCPFHDDHKPSMYVSPAKQIYKCFACGAGGGVFQFLMAYEKLSFPEAVRMLAERAGIAVPQPRPAQVQAKGLSKADLLELTTFAARFYRDQLRSARGAKALAYATSRGLSDESIKRFGLGYAPDAWDALVTAARKKGFSDAQLIAAGLASRRDSGTGCYDRLRNRLIFPIFDAAGRVIAFGGRALDESEPAKYLNSPESALFDKSATLYGLNWSRKAIAQADEAVVVEGYLDALIPLQSGIDNVVATLGTSLTDRQARLISRYAGRVVLVFDADAAGAAAAERALELFFAQQLHVRVATVPAGKDPCDLCLSQGPEALAKLLAEAPDALQYVWQRRRRAYERAGGNLADKRRLIEQFLELIASSSAYGAIDQVRRGQLLQHIGHMLNVPPAELEGQIRRISRRTARRTAAQANPNAGLVDTAAIAERHILEVLLNREDLWTEAARQVSPQDFSNATLRRIAERIWRLGEQDRFTAEQLLASEELAELGKVLAELITNGQKRGNYEQTLAGSIEHLRYRRSRQEIAQLRQSQLDEQALRRLNDRLQQSDLRRHPKIR